MSTPNDGPEGVDDLDAFFDEVEAEQVVTVRGTGVDEDENETYRYEHMDGIVPPPSKRAKVTTTTTINTAAAVVVVPPPPPPRGVVVASASAATTATFPTTSTSTINCTTSNGSDPPRIPSTYGATPSFGITPPPPPPPPATAGAGSAALPGTNHTSGTASTNTATNNNTISMTTTNSTNNSTNNNNNNNNNSTTTTTSSSKPHIRTVAGKVWVDPSLSDWPENDYRIFVGNLDPTVTDQQLYQHFAPHYPSLHQVRIVRDKHKNNTSLGYGFVSLLDPLECARAIREQDQTWLGGRPIRIKRSHWKDRELPEKQQPQKVRMTTTKHGKKRR